MFLLTYAWSGLVGAVEAIADLGDSDHIAHDLHDIDHDSAWDQDQNDDERHEDKAHHHCSHNLVGMGYALPAAHRTDAMTLLVASSRDPNYSKLHQRLLRPPRN